MYSLVLCELGNAGVVKVNRMFSIIVKLLLLFMYYGDDQLESMSSRHARETEEIITRHEAEMRECEGAEQRRAMQIRHDEERQELFMRHVAEDFDYEINRSMSSDTVPDLVVDRDEEVTFEAEGLTHEADMHRRYCWRCNGDVFVFHQGLYWCQPCLDNAGDDVNSSYNQAGLFGGVNNLNTVLFQFSRGELYNNESMANIVVRIIESLRSRVARYEREPNETMNEHDVVNWTNPFWKDGVCIARNIGNSPFVTNVFRMSELYEEIDLLGIRELFGETVETEMFRIGLEMVQCFTNLVNASFSSVNLVRNGVCGCNEIDALVFNFCELCTTHLRTLGVSINHMIDLHMNITEERDRFLEDRMVSRQYGLPEDDYDDMNRVLGNDDHGEPVALGEQYEWQRYGGEDVCVICSTQSNEMCECHNHHVFCYACIQQWEENSFGTCPVCRVPMRF